MEERNGWRKAIGRVVGAEGAVRKEERERKSEQAKKTRWIARMERVEGKRDLEVKSDRVGFQMALCPTQRTGFTASDGGAVVEYLKVGRVL